MIGGSTTGSCSRGEVASQASITSNHQFPDNTSNIGRDPQRRKGQRARAGKRTHLVGRRTRLYLRRNRRHSRRLTKRRNDPTHERLPTADKRGRRCSRRLYLRSLATCRSNDLARTSRSNRRRYASRRTLEVSQMPAHYAKAELTEREAIARFKDGKTR